MGATHSDILELNTNPLRFIIQISSKDLQSYVYNHIISLYMNKKNQYGCIFLLMLGY
jgi:hypothetical protein